MTLPAPPTIMVQFSGLPIKAHVQHDPLCMLVDVLIALPSILCLIQVQPSVVANSIKHIDFLKGQRCAKAVRKYCLKDGLLGCLMVYISHVTLGTTIFHLYQKCTTRCMQNKELHRVTFITDQFNDCYVYIEGYGHFNQGGQVLVHNRRGCSLVPRPAWFLPAGCTQSARPTGPKITLHFRVCLYLCIYASLCIPTYHVHNNYVTYIVAM